MKQKYKTIEFNLEEVKRSKKVELLKEIDKSWFDDCETDFYKVLLAKTHFIFSYKSNSVLMDLKLSFKIQHSCSRCGDLFDEDINEEILEEYEEIKTIDLFPLIRETIILNQPIKILCKKCKEKG